MGERIFKSKVLLILTEMIEEKQEDGSIIYTAINKKYDNIKGKDLADSLYQEKAQGRSRKIEVVFQEPQQIKFGVVYVLCGGKKVWIYNLKEN